MTDSQTRVATAEEFRAMMRGFPTGVAVVTTTDLTGRPWGMTCSSVCSVTLEPPTLLLSLRVGSPTLAAVLESGHFALNLLHALGQDTAELFGSSSRHRFDHVRWEQPLDAAGPHLFEDAHSIADCRVGRHDRVGDHEVVYGQPYRVTEHQGHSPLLYGRRNFRPWPGP
ncbi:flavin reductase family protein [Amycolatopsis pigmentata]|uniref:Flavin reductase family protein n=1 Tax=Amycolatopsis pigmentata TaxID=450801 RepID=A0ABW5FQH8_9PSEU